MLIFVESQKKTYISLLAVGLLYGAVFELEGQKQCRERMMDITNRSKCKERNTMKTKKLEIAEMFDFVPGLFLYQNSSACNMLIIKLLKDYFLKY